jgi:hypothetical protein
MSQCCRPLSKNIRGTWSRLECAFVLGTQKSLDDVVITSQDLKSRVREFSCSMSTVIDEVNLFQNFLCEELEVL